MNPYLARFLIFLIAYLCGSFLTAELVSKIITKKKVAELGGSANPGMANMMSLLGFKAGILVLLGDILKVLIAYLIAYYLFGGQYLFYVCLGATIGHCFPFWHQFKGGKGVATSCAGLILFDPISGFICLFIGFLFALLIGYLSLAGIVIPFVFIIFAYFKFEAEIFILSLLLYVICFYCHYWHKPFPSGSGKKMNWFRRNKE